MYNDLEHPAITAVLRDGLPEAEAPRCPSCGKMCDTVRKRADGSIAGCDECLRPYDAWECPECFPPGTFE